MTKSSPPTLRELQLSFAEGAVSGTAAGAFAAVVEETPAFSRTARLGVYAYAYGSRLRGALEEDFEAVAALLGEKRFGHLVHAYLRAHPSRSWTIGDVGEQFPVFLRGREDLSPGVSELARFEWAVVESLYADPSPESPSAPDLMSWAPERLASARLELDPSVRLLRSAWPVARLWLGRESLTSSGLTQGRREEFSLVHRTPRWVVAKILDPIEYFLLNAAFQSRPLGEWPAALAEEGLDLAKFDVAGAFAKWRAEGILTSVREER